MGAKVRIIFYMSLRRDGRGSVDKGVTQEDVGWPGRYKVPGTCEAWKMGWDCGKRCFIQRTVAGLALSL